MEDARPRLKSSLNPLVGSEYRASTEQSTFCTILDGDNEAAIMRLLRTIYLANFGYGGNHTSRAREREAAQELVLRSVQRLGRLSDA